MEQVGSWKAHGGAQGVYSHQSEETGTPMTFRFSFPITSPGTPRG